MNEEQKKRSGEEVKIGSWKREEEHMLKGNRGRIALIAVAGAALLGIGILLGAMIGKKNGGQDTAAVPQTQTAEGESSAAVPDTPLELNAHPEINELIRKYYQAAASGDVDTINTLKDYSEPSELIQIQEKSKYLEGYEDINCYTKPGPIENSYVVYVSYYARFKEIDQPVVGLNTYVVCQNEGGEYYIHDCSQDEAMREYRISVTKQDDVVELFNKVQVEYNEAVTENEELAVFLTELSDELKASVGEAIEETQAAAAQTETEEESVPAEEESGGENAVPAVTKVAANDVVNIRKSDSETAESLGKAQVGQEFTLLESRGNGWSRVEYEGGEAYIKSEFLTPVEQAGASAENGDAQGESVEPQAEGNEDAAGDEDTSEDGNTTENEASGAGAQTGENASSGSAAVPNSGTYRLTTTVNIRKSASENADRLGVGYSGDEVEILMKQADGWTKVKFKGETGYIKTEVLK